MTVVPKVFVSAIFYDPRRLPHAADTLDHLRRAMNAHGTAVVCNNPEIEKPLFERFARDAIGPLTCITHDNVGAEFGGYERGIAADATTGYDYYVFFNDTVGIHQHLGRHFLRSMWSDSLSAAPSKRVFGQIWGAERRFKILELTASRWVQSHVFAIDRAGMESLQYRLYSPEVDSLIVDTADENAFFAPELDPVVKLHLRNWLFSRSASSWYNAAPLSGSNFIRLAHKARTILQEQYLAMRMEHEAFAFRGDPMSLTDRILDRIEKKIHGLRRNYVWRI